MLFHQAADFNSGDFLSLWFNLFRNSGGPLFQILVQCSLEPVYFSYVCSVLWRSIGQPLFQVYYLLLIWTRLLVQISFICWPSVFTLEKTPLSFDHYQISSWHSWFCRPLLYHSWGQRSPSLLYGFSYASCSVPLVVPVSPICALLGSQIIFFHIERELHTSFRLWMNCA